MQNLAQPPWQVFKTEQQFRKVKVVYFLNLCEDRVKKDAFSIQRLNTLYLYGTKVYENSIIKSIIIIIDWKA